MPRLESEKSRRRRAVRLGLRDGGGAGLAQRKALDADSAAEFFLAIDSRDAPRFGLVKLAALALDMPHAAPARAQERGGALSAWAPAITLLGYAALRQTDGIVAALLRAGADPSVRWTRAGVAATAGVREYVGSLRPSYGVWVARKVVGMRRAGALASAGAGAAPCCAVCAATGTSPLLAWDGECGHLLCESCFWRTQMAHDHVGCGGSELSCPACAPGPAHRPPWAEPASGSTAAERAERKAASAHRWLALAATEAEAEAQEARNKTKKKRAKGGRTRAMPELEAAALNPGWLRGDRVERLNEAACADDVLRLLGILEAGVDVDGRSECGETAAMSAAMLGHAVSLRVLCWAGADLRIADAGGATPASAAAARGHEAALAVVHDFLDSDDSTEESTSMPIVHPQAEATLVAPPCFQSLIDRQSLPAHPGCGSGFVDNGLSTGWLQRLQDLWATLPAHVADATAGNTSTKSYAMTCATRSLFCDTEGWVEAELAPLAEQLLLHTAAADRQLAEIKVLPRMRFLCYKSQGGNMQPHVDLAKRDPGGGKRVRLSTHTFMVHLADCTTGGETVLLSKLTGAVADLDAAGGPSGDGGQLPHGVLAAVSPVRGRLLIFPHLCPHAGLPVVSVPKLFLRGELLVRWEEKSPPENSQELQESADAHATSDIAAGSDVVLRAELPWEDSQIAEAQSEPEPEAELEPEHVPVRLGKVRRPGFEALLWRLVDHGICPRIVPGASWCEPLDTQGFFRELPTPLDPGASRSKGPLPPERAHRKRAQIVAIAKLVDALLPLPSAAATTAADANADMNADGERPLVVDFCGGGGHLGLVLAAAYPEVDVLVVDYNAFKLTIGADRASEIGLNNFSTMACDVAAFKAPRPGGRFALGIALHACGAATDLSLAACAKVGASFIVSPCCVGKVAEFSGKTALGETTRICDGRVAGIKMPRSSLLGEVLSAKEYLSLAAAADYHSKEAPSPLRQAAKSFIELDRLATIAETENYRARMGKLPSEARSPKDDVLWGWPAAGSGESSHRDAELRDRWNSSEVCRSLVQGGLWMHDVEDERELPSELSVLSPAASAATLRQTMELVAGVAAARDAGVAWNKGKVAVEAAERSGYDADERAKWKALRRSRWSSQGTNDKVKEQMGKLKSNMKSGPATNAKAERRLVQELAHAACVSAFVGAPSATLYLAPPPYWPFVLNGSVQLAGPALERVVAAAAELVPVSRRRALTARRVQLGHRLVLVSEAELEQLQHRDNSSGDGVTRDATWVLAAACSALRGDGLDGMQARTDVQCQKVNRSTATADTETSDLNVCGAVRTAAPTLVAHSVAVSWRQAAAWRQKELGLEDTTAGAFTVELGI